MKPISISGHMDFHPVQGRRVALGGGGIEGSEHVESSRNVTEAVAVSYAHTQHPQGNQIHNKEGSRSVRLGTCGY